MEEGGDEAFPRTQPITKSQLRIARQTQEQLRLSSPIPPPAPVTPTTALREEDSSPSTTERYNHKNHPQYQNHTTQLQQQQQQQQQQPPQYRGISHDSLLSDELFVKLADEQDFDDRTVASS